MASDFDAVFQSLREVLAAHVGQLKVVEDSPTQYCLEGGVHPKHRAPMPVAWVEIGRAYVSYHLMPIYGNSTLLEGCSKELLARMQGKSCFNFKNVDEGLFKELGELTGASFAAFRKAGFLDKDVKQRR